ncbi:Tex family protein [Megamonas funiformis]|uniref:RNA-binding transcriptional accessory protein n=1 Tax=Megamonas funiformis TaxID=437897 RepID=A0AAW4U5Z2_9FIRM|nr:Tex family protein [Megamonas funiformis]MBD9297754.1 RNA-binding transcriptional accessory protein [Megamonas funiformis]MCB6828506.1 RNA-binding transcriptional accessory protein [Megamonas funiformis]
MLEQNITAYLANLLKLKTSQINAAIKLIDEGNTIPFIARYRKEATGDMKDEQLRDLNDKLIYVRNLIKRQNEIKNSIEEQGKMTPELSLAIDKVEKLQELEDIYLPYKQKKRTRAMIAKEKGLEPLAQFILKQEDSSEKLEDIALKYLNDEVTSSDEALAGASDIIAETISDSADIRAKLRQHLWQTSSLSITRDKEADSDEAFLMYEDYTEPIKHLPSHRILAINRGESKDILKVKLISDIDKDIAIITKFILKQNSPYKEFLTNAIIDAYKRLIFPALEREIRNQLTETAQTQAIHVFASNLKQLLLQAPLAGYTVMGLDPGYRTGCKMAIVDATGQVLDHGVLYITMSDDAKAKSAQKLLDYIQKYKVNLISIGNGTASYETEEFVANLINEHKLPVHYLITNEAGASVYSASKLAVEELPEYDVTIRGAISIARRIQDPLAELVKIEPKAIGVGQYQHDVNQKELANTLDAVIEAAVNHVGVELNTASAALLKHIAGINATVAKNIIKYRDEHGIFTSRKELLKVSRLGPTAYTQCAGFLRINGATCPLDNTPVHPESYPLAEQILAELGFSLEDLTDKNKLDLLKSKIKLVDIDKLATKLNAGVFTVKDILDALTKPGRDPREDLPAPLTRQNIIKLEDIKVGTIMRGTVRNITDFGVFVDIGIKTAGLIHISELSNKHVKHPLDVVSVGDILNVLVISVDAKRNRIGLSLKQVTKENNNVLA